MKACAGSIVMIECPDIDSKGSGFFVSSSGHVLTNNHVVSRIELQGGVVQSTYSSDIWVHHGNHRFRANLAIDPDDPKPLVCDYAILSTSISKTTALQSASINMAKQGDEVLCLGFPLDFSSLVVTSGIVSALVKRPSHWNTLHSLQTILTDCLVNFGNSGGPLFHVPSDSVIGLVTLKHPDPARLRLNALSQNPQIATVPGMSELIEYALKNVHVGLNYAVSLEYARSDSSWPG